MWRILRQYKIMNSPETRKSYLLGFKTFPDGLRASLSDILQIAFEHTAAFMRFMKKFHSDRRNYQEIWIVSICMEIVLSLSLSWYSTSIVHQCAVTQCHKIKSALYEIHKHLFHFYFFKTLILSKHSPLILKMTLKGSI